MLIQHPDVCKSLHSLGNYPLSGVILYLNKKSPLKQPMNSIRPLFVFFLLLSVSIVAPVSAQPDERKLTKKEYIERYKDDAIREMHLSGVPASITLGQGMLESSFGNSPLARYANNHFGIKCHADWDGPTFTQDDDAANECFRKYYTVFESYSDHSKFLRGRRWYAPLFELKITDYKGWARGLKKAGYATDPKYADKLIRIIEENNLHLLDKVKEMPPDKKKDIKLAEHKNTQPAVTAESESKSYQLEVRLHENNIKYVVAREGDTYASLTSELSLMDWQLPKYNEAKAERPLKVGEIVYLQPKRSKGKSKSHRVKKGDTMWTVSQLYGIKLKHLYKRNRMEPGSVLSIGQVLKLR